MEKAHTTPTNFQESRNGGTLSRGTSSSTAAPLTKKIGDAIERVGDEVEHRGFKKTGDAIEKFGDTVEHLQDRRKNRSNSLSTSGSEHESSESWIAPITERVGEFESKVENLIRTKPLAVLAGALAVGYLANKLIFSSRSSGRSASEKRT